MTDTCLVEGCNCHAVFLVALEFLGEKMVFRICEKHAGFECDGEFEGDSLRSLLYSYLNRRDSDAKE